MHDHLEPVSAAIVTMLGVGSTLALFILGVFALLDRRVDRLQNSVVRLEGKVDGLAKDHRSLARELSELRGEIRGRLGDPTAAG